MYVKEKKKTPSKNSLVLDYWMINTINEKVKVISNTKVYEKISNNKIKNISNNKKY
jgi:hypothetical protein